MWIVCGICPCGMMYGGPPHIVQLPRGCVSERAGRPPRAVSLSVHISAISWVGATHRDPFPLCALCLSMSITTVKGRATAEDTLTLLPSAHRLSFLLLTFCIRLFFQTQLPKTGGEQERGRAPERRGRGRMEKEREREQRGLEWGPLCQIQLIHFSVNRLAGQVTEKQISPDFAACCVGLSKFIIKNITELEEREQHVHSAFSVVTYNTDFTCVPRHRY